MEDVFKTLGDITNPNQNVKTAGQQNGEQKVPYVDGDAWSGITKREYFAIHILSGMVANGMTTLEGVEPPYCMGIKGRSKYAVEQADALLEALSKP